MRKINFWNFLKRHFLEFALIFISVILAFTLAEWSSNKNEKKSAKTILTEIKNGLNSDKKDFTANVEHHRISINGVRTLRNWVNNKKINQDSVAVYYFTLFRNYTPIINKTGYESLKSNGLKTIENDSLRFKIIELYEYQYKVLETLEITNYEMQDFQNFFKPTNDILQSNFNFDQKGNIIGLKPATNLTESQTQALLSYFWRMELNKKFKISRYNQVIEKIQILEKNIETEIKNDR
ncbi:MAG: hypothetical protein Q4G16_10735 [Cruoricaptor ignavus]|nr:hypothetical protein [Cruoricaptor ignavus]